MKHLSRKINKYKASTMYREQVKSYIYGLLLLGVVLAYGYISTLILEG